MNDLADVTQGFCAYCGKAQLTDGFADQEEADEWATENCDCPDAQKDRKAAGEERDRDEVLAGAKEDIQDLFSEQGVGPGKTWVDEDVLQGLYADAVQVYDEKLRRVVKTISKGITATISRTDKDQLTVQRSDRETIRRQR